jgi:glutamate dehydrogenase/leucine dehydrogenase
MDTYMNIVGTGDRNTVRGVVTGKSVSSGGSHGRAEATGQGVVHCITEWAKDRSFNLDGCYVIIQGFGNVGSYAARLLSQKGAVIVEAALVLPVMVILVLGIFEFGLLFTSYSTTTASLGGFVPGAR